MDYTTANGAATAGSDYAAQSGTLTFSPGQTEARVAVVINGDTFAEGDESFFLQLNNPKGAALLKGQGTGTIFDDDSERRLSIDDVALAEGSSGFTTNVFTVTLTGASTREVKVDYTVVSGTAVVGTDLLASSGVLTFAPGTTRAP